MTDSTADDVADLDRSIAEFEAKLGVPRGFYTKLIVDQDSDWGFVIKVHALLEAAVTHVLADALGHPELEPVLSYLPMSGERNSKIAFAKALGCFEQKDYEFARELGTLRNKYVHDIRNVGMTLTDYVNGLNQDHFKNFRSAFGPGRDPYTIGNRTVSESDFVRHNPKLNIWVAGSYVLGMANLRTKSTELEREKITFALETFAELRKFVG